MSVEFTSLAVYLTFFVARTISDLWRMVLSPYLSQYRIRWMTGLRGGSFLTVGTCVLISRR